MRKKILTAFYFVVASLILLTLKEDLSAAYYANRSQEPQYVFSLDVQLSEEEKKEQLRQDVLQWAQEYDSSVTNKYQ
ncbi:hypothetical protein MD588_09855 [Photobacterium sp. SDRW27]|uniref:hypothetical protein n=1 Tax=Photobacterium obscurum TaxID=2829490 RepID=UPI0022436646|nr:hypothetical protein [Photobacterium obscurum]MCW8329108.1 hypothetical protein [Photobacterium obscurum]